MNIYNILRIKNGLPPNNLRDFLLFRRYRGTKEITVSGVPPLVLGKSAGNPLISWKIDGNTIQNGIPTPENPIEIRGVGDYNAEIGKYVIPIKTAGNGQEISTEIYLESPLMDGETINSDGLRNVQWNVVDLGTLNWEMIAHPPYDLFVCKQLTISNTSTSFCTKYQHDEIRRSAINQNYYGNQNNIVFTDTYSNAEEFKSANQGTLLYYTLTNPTSETITVPKIQTFKGTVIFDVQTEIKPKNTEISYEKRK